MTLAAKLAGIDLEHPLMNAAGTCKTVEHLEHFVRSAVSAVVLGPATPLAREINPGNVYWQGQYYSLNSLGMPNGGEPYYEEFLPRMLELAAGANKPLIFQIAGFSPEDYVRLARLAERLGVKYIELNFGCPNVWDGGRQKGIVSFDLEAIRLIFETVREAFSGVIGLKLSPYSDPQFLTQVAELVKRLKVGYIALSNTFPNAMVLDRQGRPVISVGFGGLSGSAMKPIALGQVLQFAAVLKDDVDIVGVGGIAGGEDIVDYLNAGAVAVQASTPYWNKNEDPGVYGDIVAEYAELLENQEV
jgi:dihydroorotate dehydrogenase (fumarate)